MLTAYANANDGVGGVGWCVCGVTRGERASGSFRKASWLAGGGGGAVEAVIETDAV